MDGREFWKKKKIKTEEGERKILSEKRVCSENVERLRSKGIWINVELSEMYKDTDKQERRERIHIQQEV
jgi:hypothetical protein